ncbi:MAG: di-trans,poly-cis-decaprenylcistransferase [Gammaproteobacteria bacterium]|nr:MAG: di-trans,poly-cis-decaprenylcistransferase [Gammaproteobacteria bacterium]PIE37827.1 MAG: di-trans,poly-cis-decaprenylcistransferase [Gammaproteobacteria bacterium]
MDGNGRWARQRGRPRASGHQAGFRTTRAMVEVAARRGIEALTLFAFSSENWRRPETEVSLLMDLFLKALSSEVDKIRDNNIRMRFIGERSAFGEKLQRQMQRAETVTDANDGMELAIAVNYGGRWDIVNAARHIAEAVSAGHMQPDEITTGTFSAEVSLADLPEPDLFIRTGGEQRISNYLLWHLAYTELYFTDVLWPDFSADEFERSLQHFAGRQRRFGQTGEQVSGKGA